ncbi:Elicitor-responsive protein 3 [Linum grandiflorum]
MSFASVIQGQPLEVTVVGCTKLKDTEWISRQDPYVCVEYGNSKSRTRTCTDGGKNPTFQEKFVFTLIEGLRELDVVVWNSNTLKFDDFIGTGKVQLHKVLSEGYDDTAWPLKTKTGRHAGEVRLIMHYANAKKQTASHSHSAPPYGAHAPHASMYSAPPQSAYAPPHTAPGYASAPPAAAYPSYPQSSYPQQHTPYAPSPYPSMPNAYPPHSAYAYPPHSAYPPPPSSAYPQASPYPPPGPHGHYPPPPY